MLKKELVGEIGTALAELKDPESAGAWSAIGPLDRLARNGLSVAIDLEASQQLGATVIVALPRAAKIDFERLSPRRREVAEMMLSGASNKVIARRLGISLGTVKDHVHDILTILGYASRTEMIAATVATP